MLGYSLGNLVKEIESTKIASHLGAVSAIRRVSMIGNEKTSENVILQEYVRVLQGFMETNDPSTGDAMQYTHKTPLYHVFGEGISTLLKKLPSTISFSTPNLASKSSMASQYDIEISLDSIHLTGFASTDIEGNNKSKLLKRDSPTLFLKMSIENSILKDMLTNHNTSTSTSTSASSSSTLVLKLHYSPSTMSWILKPSSSFKEKITSDGSTILSLNSSYLDKILYCELSYKTLITRNQVLLGVAYIPLGGLDNKETELRQPIEVQNNNIQCKKNNRIELQIQMKLKQKT